MATWRDGPEYAPLVRPVGFDVPDLPRLDGPRPDGPVAPRPESAHAPLEHPRFQQQENLQPLDRLGLPTGAGKRDPHESFQVASSAMTTSSVSTTSTPNAPSWGTAREFPSGGPPTGMAPSAWSAVHDRPQQNWYPQDPSLTIWGPPTGSPAGGHRDQASPPQLPPQATHQTPLPAPGPPGYPFPAPGSNQWFGPGVPSPRPRQANKLTVGGFLSGIDAFVFTALVLGGIIQSLAPLMFIVAMMLSVRVKYRAVWVRNTFWVGAATVFTTLMMSVAVSAGDFTLWYDILSRVSMIVCLGVLAVVSILVSLALTNGEPPETGSRNQPGPR